MAYICAHCGKKVKDLDNFIRCPYCGSRVFLKGRPNIPREISTD